MSRACHIKRADGPMEKHTVSSSSWMWYCKPRMNVVTPGNCASVLHATRLGVTFAFMPRPVELDRSRCQKRVRVERLTVGEQLEMIHRYSGSAICAVNVAVSVSYAPTCGGDGVTEQLNHGETMSGPRD
jgi:hypothetical protein